MALTDLLDPNLRLSVGKTSVDIICKCKYVKVTKNIKTIKCSWFSANLSLDITISAFLVVVSKTPEKTHTQLPSMQDEALTLPEINCHQYRERGSWYWRHRNWWVKRIMCGGPTGHNNPSIPKRERPHHTSHFTATMNNTEPLTATGACRIQQPWKSWWLTAYFSTAKNSSPVGLKI
jgi:hypothetical protein